MTIENLPVMSAVTENASLTPAYLNSKMDVIAGNINSINTSTQSFGGLSMETLSVYRSGATGTIAADYLNINMIIDGEGVAIWAGGVSQWAVQKTTGNWLPLRVISASEGTMDIGSTTTPVRATHTNHLGSLRTMAGPSSLSAGEVGLVYEGSAMSFMARSGDTIYDLKDSLISVAVS